MAGRHNGQHQGGAALLMFMVLAVMATLTYLVNSVSSAEIELKRQRKTEAALALAKDALIGYALTYRDRMAAQDTNFTDDDDAAMYGYLPMPDIGKRGTTTDENCKDSNGRPMEGCQAPPSPSGISKVDDANGDGTNDYLPTLVGRFPWRTLGVPPLRDGYGECLWLIVSSLALSGNATQTKFSVNWDTLGHIDIQTADGTDTLESLYASKPYDRPWAVVFSPGPRLSNQNRAKQSKGGDPRDEDDVTECGGNYDARNYLDPFDLNALNGTKNTLANFYHASDDPNDHETRSNTPIPITAGGNLSKSGSEFKLEACVNANCEHLSNDIGLTITSDTLFGAIRKNHQFRSDLREMLKRMAKCWSRNLATLVPITIDEEGTVYAPPTDKIAGRMPAAPPSCNDTPDTAYGSDQDPKGYFTHYDEMIFIARPEPASGSFTVNGDDQCKGVVLFSGPRIAGKKRIDVNDKKTLSNYLEGDNLKSLLNPGGTFGGDSADIDVAPRSDGTDIAVCIPDSTVYDPVLATSNSLGKNDQLVAYYTGTPLLTLGKEGVSSDTHPASSLFGCAWYPEQQARGFRAYFNFRIENSGHGFTFAAVDARRNGVSACGAAAGHLGYSGDNTHTSPIVHPKIGIEIDTSQQTGAYPGGRADPDYPGGHLSIVYWGEETTLDDDNVHGRPAATVPPADPATRPPPGNPPAPFGVASLDSKSVSNLIGKNIHVRIEIAPVATDSALRSTRYRVQAWLVKGNDDVNIVAAMKTTTRPLADLYPGIDTAVFIHLLDQPTIYDLAGPSCASDACPDKYECGTDRMCYMKAFQSIRPGFTVSQGTSSKDQVIRIRDLVSTWLP